jgi:hypothetical protein
MTEFIATIMAGMWAGTAIYIGLVEHPSALRVGLDYATEYFRPMSKRTAPLMMVYAATGGIAAIVTWNSGGDVSWLIGGVLLLSMFPFTAIFIVPTNIRLLKVDVTEADGEAKALHARWGRMHAWRTAFGSPPFLIFVWQLVAAP